MLLSRVYCLDRRSNCVRKLIRKFFANNKPSVIEANGGKGLQILRGGSVNDEKQV